MLICVIIFVHIVDLFAYYNFWIPFWTWWLCLVPDDKFEGVRCKNKHFRSAGLNRIGNPGLYVLPASW